MTGFGIQAWLLSSIGIRTAFVHREIMEILELLHILGNSYRLASLGGGSAVVYGRFTLGFCRTVAVGAVCHLASRCRFRQLAAFEADAWHCAPTSSGSSMVREFRK